jgi:hypothetical protein
MEQQTAVNWLLENIQKVHKMDWDIVFVQAMMMEKEQIIKAFKTGEYNSVDYFNPEYPHQECSKNYYNETYNK